MCMTVYLTTRVYEMCSQVWNPEARCNDQAAHVFVNVALILEPPWKQRDL